MSGVKNFSLNFLTKGNDLIRKVLGKHDKSWGIANVPYKFSLIYLYLYDFVFLFSKMRQHFNCNLSIDIMDQCTKIDLKKGQEAVEKCIYTVKDNVEEEMQT